jgi:hypothetical protein
MSGQGAYFNGHFFDVEKALALLQKASEGDDIQYEADSFIGPWQCDTCGKASGCECDTCDDCGEHDCECDDEEDEDDE